VVVLLGVILAELLLALAEAPDERLGVGLAELLRAFAEAPWWCFSGSSSPRRSSPSLKRPTRSGLSG